MNPAHFAKRSLEETLSTLVHEMVHLWQHHHGRPSGGGYHNAEWARKMREVGLTPTSTGDPGGKDVGQKMSHLIVEGGRYQKAFALLKEQGLNDLYVERSKKEENTAKKKAASKTKFTCPICAQNAWAKSEALLVCGSCDVTMLSTT